jgi:hypothetical protein
MSAFSNWSQRRFAHPSAQRISPQRFSALAQGRPNSAVQQRSRVSGGQQTCLAPQSHARFVTVHDPIAVLGEGRSLPRSMGPSGVSHTQPIAPTLLLDVSGGVPDWFLTAPFDARLSALLSIVARPRHHCYRAPGCAPVIAASVEICCHEQVICGAKEAVGQRHGCGLPRAQ